MADKIEHLASLKQRLEAEGFRVGYGDTTTESGTEDPHYLLTIFSPSGEDGLWVMDDWGLTAVIYRAYRTPRVGTVDPEALTLREAVGEVKRLLYIDPRTLHDDLVNEHAGTQAAPIAIGPRGPEEI